MPAGRASTGRLADGLLSGGDVEMRPRGGSDGGGSAAAGSGSDPKSVGALLQSMGSKNRQSKLDEGDLEALTKAFAACDIDSGGDISVAGRWRR